MASFDRAKCGATVHPDETCAQDGAECFIVDDQFFVVPAQLAPTVFNYTGSATLKYADPDWCAAPPLNRMLQARQCYGVEMWTEIHFTYYLSQRAVPVTMIEACARLPRWGRKFACAKEFDCAGPHEDPGAAVVDTATAAAHEGLRPQQPVTEQVAPQQQSTEAGESAATSVDAPEPVAAICLSGQVRSLLDVYETIRTRLVDPFAPAGGASVFMHVSLTSQYPSSHPTLPNVSWTITRQQLQPALDVLRPAKLTIYEEGIAFSKSLQPSTCYRSPEAQKGGDWSYHGAQFQGVSQCFAQILRAEKSAARPFRFTIRARLDAVPLPEVVDLIGEALQESEETSNPSRSPLERLSGRSGWVRMAAGSGSDALLFAKGNDATLAIASVWEEFGGDNCSALPEGGASMQMCAPFKVAWSGTECLVVRHVHWAMKTNPIPDNRLILQELVLPGDASEPSAVQDCAPRCGMARVS